MWQVSNSREERWSYNSHNNIIYIKKRRGSRVRARWRVRVSSWLNRPRDSEAMDHDGRLVLVEC